MQRRTLLLSWVRMEAQKGKFYRHTAHLRMHRKRRERTGRLRWLLTMLRRSCLDSDVRCCWWMEEGGCRAYCRPPRRTARSDTLILPTSRRRARSHRLCTLPASAAGHHACLRRVCSKLQTTERPSTAGRLACPCSGCLPRHGASQSSHPPPPLQGE